MMARIRKLLTQKVGILTLFLLLVAVPVSFAVTAQVSAAPCPANCDYPAAGRDFWRGYLTNRDLLTGSKAADHGAVWQSSEAPWSVNSADSFIAWMQPFLFDNANGSVNNHTGAATYVVSAMLGSKGPDFGGNFLQGVTSTRSRWADWQSLVRYYDSQGWVNWNSVDVDCTPYVQANLDYRYHDLYYFKNANTGACDVETTITFHNPTTGSTFRLKKVCGNPVGNNEALPLGNFNYVSKTVSDPATNPAPIPGNGSGSAVNSGVYPGQTLKFDITTTNTGTATGPVGRDQGKVYALDPSAGMPYYYNDPGCGGSCYNTPANSTSPQQGIVYGTTQGYTYNPNHDYDVPALAPGQVHVASPNSPGASPRSYSFTIPADAPVGRKYCFYSHVNPSSATVDYNTSNFGAVCFLVQAPIAAICEGVTVTPAAVDPNSPYSVTVRVRYGSASEATTAMGQPGARFYTTVTGPGTNLPTASISPLQYDGSGGVSGTVSYPALNKTGDFVVWYGIENTTNVGKVNCLGGFSVANRPYFQVNGGDVTAGAGMSIGGSECASSGGVNAKQDASIVSWNRGATGSYGGAGTPFGALALNHLQGFATGQGSGLSPYGVSFANTGGTTDQKDEGRQLYGGEFGGTNCTADFFKNATGVQTGNITIGGQAIANGTRQTIYVDGNVYITGNITFSGNYATAADIPAFSIVVRGNIYIAPGVTQLDGFYIAEPSSATATNGIIYTCAASAFTPASLNRNLQSTCGNALTVNGGFVGRQIWLMRTAGTITSTPAETFNYVPEAWLSAPYGNGLDPGGTDGYDAITSLPPVL